MTTLRTLAITLIATGLLACAATLPLYAQKPDRLPPPPTYDAKTYHASMCKPTWWHHHILVDSSGIRPKYDFDSILVICPIVRDDATGTDGVMRAWMKVSDTDPNETYDIVCNLISYDKWNQVVDSDEDRTVGAPGLDTLRMTVTQSAEYGTYAIGCDLYNTTAAYELRLISYAVDEFQSGYDGMSDYDN